jgi:hypothetical protein
MIKGTQLVNIKSSISFEQTARLLKLAVNNNNSKVCVYFKKKH